MVDAVVFRKRKRDKDEKLTLAERIGACLDRLPPHTKIRVDLDLYIAQTYRVTVTGVVDARDESERQYEFEWHTTLASTPSDTHRLRGYVYIDKGDASRAIRPYGPVDFGRDERRDSLIAELEMDPSQPTWRVDFPTPVTTSNDTDEFWDGFKQQVLPRMASDGTGSVVLTGEMDLTENGWLRRGVATRDEHQPNAATTDYIVYKRDEPLRWPWDTDRLSLSASGHRYTSCHRQVPTGIRGRRGNTEPVPVAAMALSSESVCTVEVAVALSSDDPFTDVLWTGLQQRPLLHICAEYLVQFCHQSSAERVDHEHLDHRAYQKALHSVMSRFVPDPR